MYPECEFAPMMLQVKTRECDRIEESQMPKMTMRAILVPLIGMRKLMSSIESMLNMEDWGDTQLEILAGWKFYTFNMCLSNPRCVFLNFW